MNECVRLLLAVCGMVVLAACGEDTIVPSSHERNWLVVEDNPLDSLDHLRYEVYKQTGIPVYYNDTIGSEQRTTLAGQPYTYYEVLQVFYSPGRITPSWAVANYQLPQHRADVPAVVAFLRDEVFPQLGGRMYVPSVLLVDTLNSTSGTVAYRGMNTIVLSNVRRFSGMDSLQRKAYKGSFLRAAVAGTLMNCEEEWLEENFFALTYAVNPDYKAFAYSTSSVGYGVYKALQGFPLADQRLSVLGFIGTRVEPQPGVAERSWLVPEKHQDVDQFCEAVINCPQAVFEAAHAGEEVVLAKYCVMRKKLLEYGIALE